ncbi:MAG: NAD(P)-binding domain-containing protein, partial [Lachnospiraceae bacterium]|nr:NAD(P)-binding domain-containing protein [Lachnospiraceae bacterium]
MQKSTKNNNIKIAVLGSGTFGIALASLLCKNGHDVMVWSKFEEEIKELQKTHRQKNLKGLKIPSKIKYTTDISEACKEKDMVVFAVPSPFVRSTAREAIDYISKDTVIVDVAKGIEKDTYFTMSQIISSELKKKKKKYDIVALSGPTHAEEVAIELPTLIVAASKSENAAKFTQKVFMNDYFRVYTNNDIKGCEVCG